LFEELQEYADEPDGEEMQLDGKRFEQVDVEQEDFEQEDFQVQLDGTGEEEDSGSPANKRRARNFY
jgi:hypothetical protein